MLTRQITGTLSRAQSRGDEASVTITTPDRDLMGDRIDHMQMDTDTYLAGPASINYAHDHSNRLPVAKTIALTKSPTGIRAQFRWRNDPFSREVKAAFDDDVLGASVEFIVPEGGAVPNQVGGFDFRKTILTGWAFTGNPANPRAVKLLKTLRDNLNAIDEDLTLDVIGWFPREEEKMMFDANLVRTLVEKAIREAVRPKSSDEWNAPVWVKFREQRRIVEESDRRWKRDRAKAERNQKAWAEWVIQRSNDLAFCPCLSPPTAY